MSSELPPMKHRVHGLSGDDAAPDWPPLERAEIDAVLARLDLAASRGSAWASPRPLSAAALVDTGDRRVFIKRHHRRVRNAPDLAEEHRFMAHLAARGIPVPAVLATRDGATAITRGDWVYEAHAAAGGRDLYRDSMSWTPLRDHDHAFAAGAMLARLHAAAADFEAPQRRTHLLVARDDLLRAADPLAALQQQLGERPGLDDYLAGRPWREDLGRLLGPRHPALHDALARQPRRWSHNDWHVSNLCWDGDGAVSDVLDFGLAAPTGALFDLATAIERNAVDWLRLDSDTDIAHADSALALLAGYRFEHDLDADDLATLIALLPVVHVEFALSEVDYFHAILGDRARADLAYDGFLLAHADWFDQAAGRAFLDALVASP